MKTTHLETRKKRYFDTAIAIAEGLWNGIIISGVVTVSALLIDRFWIL